MKNTILKQDNAVAKLLALLNNSEPPRFTLLMRTPGGGTEDPMHIQRALGFIDDLEKEEDLKSHYGQLMDQVLKSAKETVEETSNWSDMFESICLYASTENSYLYKLDYPIKQELAFLGDDFLFKSSLQQIASEFIGYALHLSLKEPRIFRLQGNTIDLIKDAELPESIYELSDPEVVDSGLRAHVRHSKQREAPEIVAQGVGSSDSPRELNLPAFMRQVNHALYNLNMDPEKPLVCIGDQKVVAEFTKQFKGPQSIYTVTDASAPLEEGKVVEACSHVGKIRFEEIRDSIMESLMQVSEGDTRLFSDNLREIYQASMEGRIDKCMVAVDAIAWNRFDEASAKFESVSDHDAISGKEVFEALDKILVNTLLKGGQAIAVSQKKIPNEKSAAALFRW